MEWLIGFLNGVLVAYAVVHVLGAVDYVRQNKRERATWYPPPETDPPEPPPAPPSPPIYDERKER